MKITGRRVFLSSPTDADKQQISTWNEDPEVSRCREIGRVIPSHPDYNLGIYDAETGDLIGDIGIVGVDLLNKHAEIGIAIGDKRYWGKGYGTDTVMAALRFCFNELKINKVYLDVWAENERAIRCYEKCGFVVDGVMRQHVCENGTFHDKLMMSVLRSEWETVQA